MGQNHRDLDRDFYVYKMCCTDGNKVHWKQIFLCYMKYNNKMRKIT